MHRADADRAIRALAATGEMAILLCEQYYDFARGAGSDMERDGVKALLAV